MTDLTPDKLDEIEKAAKEATPGPWYVCDYDDLHATDRRVLIWGDCAGNGVMADEDARHIVTMDPATTLALVARVRKLEARVDRARGEIFDELARSLMNDPKTGGNAVYQRWLGKLVAELVMEGE